MLLLDEGDGGSQRLSYWGGDWGDDWTRVMEGHGSWAHWSDDGSVTEEGDFWGVPWERAFLRPCRDRGT